MERIYTLLYEKVNSFPNTYITLNTLYDFIEESSRDLRNEINAPQGYKKFAQAVLALIEQGVLNPVKNSRTNSREIKLSLKYRKVRPETDFDSVRKEIRKLSPYLKIDHYYAHPEEYLKDKEYVKKLDKFFREGNISLASINERSFQIFDDEKFLKGSRKTVSGGERILKNLGLTFQDLNCFLTYEPFFYRLVSTKEYSPRKVLIVENMDTFWSFDHVLSQQNKADIDILLYGEGYKIVNSFRFGETIGLSKEDKYAYFGDLDPEGINNLGLLKEEFPEFEITPFVEVYQIMVDLAEHKGLRPFSDKQRLNRTYYDDFLSYLDKNYHEKVEKIISQGLYVPQEIVSLPILKECFGGFSE